MSLIKNTSLPHYRPDIDGLRAIAIISVLLFHAFPFIFKNGFLGVDVFFVISGYLVTSIICKSADDNKFSFKNFYSRRIKRIFPAVLLVVFVSLVLGWWLLWPSEYALLGRHIIASLGFVQNFNLMSEAGYFDQASDLKPFLHLWSLSVEEQFYLFWPLFLLLRKKKYFEVLFVGVFCLSLGAHFYWKNSEPIIEFYHPLSRFWELFVGGAIYLFPKIKIKQKAVSDILAIVFLGILFNSLASEKNSSALLLTVTATGGLLLTENSVLNRKILSNKLLVWLGLISFPLYLWHWLLLSLYSIVTPVPDLWGDQKVKVAILGISVFLSALTYYFLERPIRFGTKFKYPVRSLIVLSFVLAGTSLLIFSLDGILKRFPEDMQAVIFSQEELIHSRIVKFTSTERCKKINKTGNFCLETKVEPSVALIGDSMAEKYFLPLVRHYIKEGSPGLVYMGYFATPPYYGVNSVTTKRNINFAFDEAINNPKLKTVILASMLYYDGSIEYSPDKINDEFKLKGIHIDRKTMIERTIKMLSEAKKEIIIILPNPIIKFDPKLCFFRPIKLGSNVDFCYMYRNPVQTRQLQDYIADVESAVQNYPNVKIFDPGPYLCEEEFCQVKRNGKIMYKSDRFHLTDYGAQWVINNFDY